MPLPLISGALAAGGLIFGLTGGIPGRSRFVAMEDGADDQTYEQRDKLHPSELERLAAALGAGPRPPVE